MPGRLEFGVQFGSSRKTSSGPRDESAPLRILVMGDFSGRKTRSGSDPSTLGLRSIAPIDIDEFDKVLKRIAPAVEFGDGTTATFAELDDFHPDRLCRSLSAFSALRDLRRRIGDPSTFEAAAAELSQVGLQPPVVRDQSGADPNAGTAPGETGEATLERLLGAGSAAQPSGSAQYVGSRSGIDSLIRQIVAPHVDPSAPVSASPYLNAIDLALAERMRAVLHGRDFQALEAGWRGLRWLVESLDLDQAARLSLVDISREELLADAEEARDSPRESFVYGLVTGGAGQRNGESPWSLIIGNYEFGNSEADVIALRLMGAVAADLGAAFIAAATVSDPASPDAGETAGNEHWHMLRSSEVAPHIGLALPRILSRLPYGARTDPIDEFDFEELGACSSHESFLWGNPAFGCALLIGLDFMSEGWNMVAGRNLTIEDLPAYCFEQQGESQLLPCSEVPLTQRMVDTLLDNGLMPFLGYANRNAVRLMRIQSIADPLQALAGPWRLDVAR